MPILAIVLVCVTAAIMMTPYYMLAAAPALGLFGILVFLHRPAWGLYAIIFLIPFGSYRSLGGALNLPWLFAGGLLGMTVLRAIMDKDLPGFLRSNLWPSLLLLLAVVFAATLMSPFRETAVHNLVLQVAAIGYIALVLSWVDEDAWRTVVPAVTAWSISIGSALAAGGYYLGLTAFTEEHNSGALTRSVGGAIDPNNLCLMIVVGMPIIIHRAVYARTGMTRFLMSGLAAVNVIAVATTFSRSGAMLLALTLLLILFQYRSAFSPRLLGKVLALGMVGGTAFIAAVPQTFWDRQLSLLAWEDNSLNRRSSYIDVGVASFMQDPFLGKGPGTFSRVYAGSTTARAFTANPDRRARRAHNTYMEYLVGTGILGLTAFLLVVWRGWRNFGLARRVFADAGDAEGANLSASWRISMLALLLFLGLFSEEYHKHLLLILPLSWISLAIARQHRTPGTRQEDLAHA